MTHKRIIIAGATSGMGYELAKKYIEAGNKVGVIGRREKVLEELQALQPDKVFVKVIDITTKESGDLLKELVTEVGGMDCYIHVSGVGSQNFYLDEKIEMNTVQTNCIGFTRMIDTAFNIFAEQGYGHIAAITSVAGTKGLGVTPSYSASKRFQSIYLQSLAQLSHIRKLKIKFTDIRPGFVNTDLLKHKYNKLLLMDKKYASAIIYKAINAKRRVKIIDFRYAIIIFFWRLAPNCLWEKMNVTTKD